MHRIMHWGRRIEQEIDRVFQHITGAQQLKGIYNEKRRQFSLVKNQPREIVEKVASDIEKLLAKKRKALDRLASEAERLQREHLWQDGIKWWNELPAALRTAESLTILRKRLKTNLFRVHLDSA
ncbi:unnamed protein product [Boreogadus saida]